MKDAMKYNPEWMFAVLEDLRAFADENKMSDTEAAISMALAVSRSECSGQRKNRTELYQGLSTH